MITNYIFKLHGSYSEVDQTLPLYYQFVEKEGDTLTALSGWFKCRDYFNEAVCNYHLNTNYSKYGFSIKFNKPIFKDKFYILLGINNCDEHLNKMFTKNIEYLKDTSITELSLPTKKTSSFYGFGLNKFYLLETDPKWFKSTIHISLFSLLVRLCSSDEHPPNKLEKGVVGTGTDREPLAFLEFMSLEDLLSVLDDIVGDDVPICNINYDYASNIIHNYTGIGTLFQKYKYESKTMMNFDEYREKLKQSPIGNYIINLHNILGGKND